MTSDASSSGTGGWPGQSGGGNEPAGQWPQQQPQPGWGQQPPAQQPPGWGQQPQRPQQGWGQQPAPPSQPQAGQPQASQPQAGQPAQGGQQQGWGQQPAQPARPSGQPASGQWGQQPQQSGSQWGQQGQQGQAQQGWGQQPQQPGSQWGQPASGQWGQQPQQPASQWGQQGQSQQGWGQQGWGQAGSQWAPTLPSAWDEADPWGSDSYPVDVRFTPEGRIGRYWGIPIIGHAVRALCVIPHVLVLMLFALVVAIGALFLWIPVLINGRQAGWAYAAVGGFLRWSIRVQTWAQLMSGTYPPFTGAEADGQHVRVRIDQDQRINRFWGIPILGWLIRYIILIPHLIILWVLAIVVWFIMWFAWIPVLIFGRQADLVYSLVGGFIRWQARVGAYLLLLSGPYPPFRLD